MKKILFALGLFVALAGFSGLSAAETPAAPAAEEPRVTDYDNFEMLMLCIWEGLPDYSETSPTYGVKVGILGSGGAPVYGVEAAVICAGSDDNSGFKGSLAYTLGKELYGLALAPVNYIEQTVGVQIGAVNIARSCSIQFGLLNFMEDGFLPVFPLVNIAVK